MCRASGLSKRASLRMRVVPRRLHCPLPGPLRSPAIGGLDVVDTFTAAVSVTAKKTRPFWLVTIC